MHDDAEDNGDALRLRAHELRAVDAARATLETHLSWITELKPGEREGLNELTPEREAFCRQALMRLVQNPQLSSGEEHLPRVNEYLRVLDQLGPRLRRLQQLGRRADDTMLAMGSDIVFAALLGYSLLEAANQHHDLDASYQAAFGRRGRRAVTRPPGDGAT